MARRKNDLGFLNNMGAGTSDDDDDDNLEAELNAIMGGAIPKKQKPKKLIPVEDLNAMVRSCMEDVPEDIEVDIEGEDKDLLDELAMFDEADEPPVPTKPAPPVYSNNNLLSIVDERIKAYSIAEKTAKEAGESSRARRYARALASLTDIRRKLKIGKPVQEEDIPPAIKLPKFESNKPIEDVESSKPFQLPSETVKLPSEPPKVVDPPMNSPKLPAASMTISSDPVLLELNKKRDHYKHEALSAKQKGNKEEALEALKSMKVMDAMILKHKKSIQEGHNQSSENTFDKNAPLQLPDNPEDLPPADPSLFGAPPPPSNLFEALTQRLDKYKSDMAKCKDNPSKQRRLGRIVKQYEDAIKAAKSNRKFAFEELPVPPGYGSIPNDSAPQPVVSQPKPKLKSVQNKQLTILLQRQALFKEAALGAKKSGQLKEAKEYLRHYKGFDKLIEASRGGLPVDLTSTPVPPQQKKENVGVDFEIISRDEEIISITDTDRHKIFSKLESDLMAQIKMCEANVSHFKHTGDIASSNKFSQMENHSKKDLSALRHSFSLGEPAPKFHYEVRSFSKIQCNIDLPDTELSVEIIEALNLPKSGDLFVKFEFPWPKDDPFKDKTSVIKDTREPRFDHFVKIPINHKDKSFQRLFKRGALKAELFAKGGFLRSDIFMGTVNAKLSPLESQCTLHDTYPLMDGRKACGGTLEIKVRLRNPIVNKQIEKVQEKWLVIAF